MDRRTLWVIMVGYWLGIAGTFNEFVVPPIVPLFRAHFHLSAAGTGWLMSIFAFTSIVSAWTGSRLIRRFGAKMVGIGGLGANVLAVLITQIGYTFDHIALVLVGRGVGGIGFGWISVAAPVLISSSVRPQHHRIAMGIWSTWVPIGSVAMFAVAPYLTADGGWVSITVLLVAVTVIGLMFLAGTHFQSREVSSAPPGPAFPLRRRFRWLMAWIAGTFALFTVQFFGFNTWVTTFLIRDGAMSLPVAGLWAAVGGLVTATFNVVGGIWLSWALRRGFFLYVGAALVLSALWLLLPHTRTVASVMGVVGVGLVAGGIPTLMFAAPGLAAEHPGELAWGMAWVIVGENTGIIIGPPLFGALWARGGFSLAFGVLAGVALLMAMTIRQVLHGLRGLTAQPDESI